ncbi:MAG: hypothetical protein LBQ81_09940 [Zoogloeaceae bacterium]|jgi:hypothetical protein|nr:hypothetical protein [Zoogloeaceae bacterium]
MTSYAFYHNSALSIPITTLAFERASPQRVVWLGSREPGRRLAPPEGQSAITASLAGELAPHARLALTPVGLASATPGAALNLGALVTGKLSIYIALGPNALPATAAVATLALAATEERRT